MQLWDSIDPAQLTGYARESLADREQNAFTLSRWLPSRQVDDLLYRFTRGGTGLVEAATFRSYDAESGIASRENVTRVTGELPPISRKIRMGEYDQLRRRANSDQAVEDQVFNDTNTVVQSIAARLELARGEALVSGSVAISENGVIATANYGRAGGHTVSTGTSWATTGSADPLADLRTWKAVYLASNGVNPEAMVTSSRVLGYMQQNTALRTLAGAPASGPSVISIDQINAILMAFGLPTLYVYDTSVKVAGSSTKVIADDKLILLPAPDQNPETNELGGTLWGTTVEATEPGYNLAGAEAGIVAGAYKSEDPVAIWTKAAAIAIPVLANPDLSLCADVIL